MTTNTQSNVEEYEYGIVRYWLEDERIVVVKTQGDMSRNAINTWASLLILTMQEWKSERPIAVLNDLSHPSQGLNAHSRERTIDLLNHIPKNQKVYSAVILPNTFMFRIIDMFLRQNVFRRPDYEVQVFNNQEAGVAWLRDCLD